MPDPPLGGAPVAMTYSQALTFSPQIIYGPGGGSEAAGSLMIERWVVGGLRLFTDKPGR